MALVPALRAAVAALWSHTSDPLPTFFLTPAVAAVARVLVVAGAGISAACLAATGRLARVRSEIQGSDLGSIFWVLVGVAVLLVGPLLWVSPACTGSPTAPGPRRRNRFEGAPVRV